MRIQVVSEVKERTVITHVCHMPASVRARAALMGWTHRADVWQGDKVVAGAWGKSRDDAENNLRCIRREAADARVQAQVAR